MPESAVANGATVTLTYDEDLQATNPVPGSGKGPVYLAVIGGPGAQRGIETARSTSAQASGRTVRVTLDRAVEYGQRVTLSYFVDNAVENSRVRDRSGRLANGFSGFDVRNETPEGPHVDDVAFAGTARTYKIGDTVEIDVTFSEAVRVTGTPSLDLEIGSATRPAVWTAGQAAGAVQRFEYTVVEGDEDTNGIEIPVGTLGPPGSIVTVAESEAESEAVILNHGRTQDPARPVDGILPTASSATAAGPTVTVTWSEALDTGSAPSGAGGFRVRIANAAGPAVTAVSVSGSTTVLSLASAIADGTQNVTLEYAPPSGAQVRDAAGNEAKAFPRTGTDSAPALGVTVTPDTRAPELTSIVVDGATLTLTYDEALKRTDPTPSGSVAVYRVAAEGASPATLSSIRAGVGSNRNRVTMTLDPPAEAGQTIGVSYWHGNATAASKVQDLAGNNAGGFLANDPPVPVQNVTPGVETVAFAGTAGALGIGGKVAVEAVFTEAVTVTRTSTARPQVAVEVGTNTRPARYVSGGGSATLRFEYTVAEGDEDNDGIAIAAGEIALPTGSAIRTRTGNRTVHRGYDAVAADPARIVDGTRPTADTAAAEGLTVTVTWSEAIDAASARSDAGGFVLRYGGSVRPAVTAVAVDGTDATMVRLTVDAQIPDGTADATLAWSPPGSGAKIRDLAGNEPDAFTASGDRVAVSVTPDTTAPKLASARVDGAVMTLTFDEPLDRGSVPAAPGGFTVTVTRDGSPVSGHTVNGVGVSGAVVTLALAQGVLPGDTVTLAYARPSTSLRDRASTPNEVANFTTGAGTPPVPAVVNVTGALEVTLSTAQATEGDDRTVTLTVALPGGAAAGADREIAVAPDGTPTAAETEDWTLETRTATLAKGANSVEFSIGIVDDARLEAEESVTFAVTADGAEIGKATLTVADVDRAVLAVVGPEEPVAEGDTAFALKLRLEPHPDNGGPPLADDACFLDFPVTAELSAGSGGSELSGTPALPADYTFPATAFDDCTREVTVDLATRASDGDWARNRTVAFALAPKTGQDARIDPGAGEVEVRDDTPSPGPLVERIEMPAAPPGRRR